MASVIHLAWNCLINTRPKLKTWPLNPVPFPRKKRQIFSGLLSSSRHVFTNLVIYNFFLPSLFVIVYLYFYFCFLNIGIFLCILILIENFDLLEKNLIKSNYFRKQGSSSSFLLT